MAKYWYTYCGSIPCSVVSRVLTVNWCYAGVNYNNSWCPGGFITCCAIYATGAAGPPSSGTHPSAAGGPGRISTNLQSYLTISIGSSKRYPVIGKAYVYNRS